MLPVIGGYYQSRVDKGFPIVQIEDCREVKAGGRVSGVLWKADNGKWYISSELEELTDQIDWD